MRFYDIEDGVDNARQIDLSNSHHFWGSDLAFCATGREGLCAWIYLVNNSNVQGVESPVLPMTI